MTAGAEAVKNRRRVKANEDAVKAAKDCLSPFEMLDFGLLTLIFQHVQPTLRTLWMLRLVCREWTQIIEAHLRGVAHRYYVYSASYEDRYTSELFASERMIYNLFAESGWMVDVKIPLELNTPRFRQVRVFRLDEFPSGTDQRWLYSVVSQLATLPLLEDIELGSEDWNGMNFEGIDEDVHLAILRAMFAQLKRVHTFRGTLGLFGHAKILLIDIIKDMPALRNVDFLGSHRCHCLTSEPPDPPTAAAASEAIQSLSKLRLDSIKGIDVDIFFWTHFSPADQVQLRTLYIEFFAQHEKGAPDLVTLLDKVRLMPALEELDITLSSFEGEFCDSNWSHEHDRAPDNVAFCRAFQTQVEKFISKAMGLPHFYRGSDDTHEALILWAFGILAPHISRITFDYT